MNNMFKEMDKKFRLHPNSTSKFLSSEKCSSIEGKRETEFCILSIICNYLLLILFIFRSQGRISLDVSAKLTRTRTNLSLLAIVSVQEKYKVAAELSVSAVSRKLVQKLEK